MDWKVFFEVILFITKIGLIAFIGYLIFQYRVKKSTNEHQENLLEKRLNHEKEMIKLRHDHEKEKAMTLNKNIIINYKHEIIKEFVKDGKTSSEHIENLSAILKLYNPENQQS